MPDTRQTTLTHSHTHLQLLEEVPHKLRNAFAQMDGLSGIADCRSEEMSASFVCLYLHTHANILCRFSRSYIGCIRLAIHLYASRICKGCVCLYEFGYAKLLPPARTNRTNEDTANAYTIAHNANRAV